MLRAQPPHLVKQFSSTTEAKMVRDYSVTHLENTSSNRSPLSETFQAYDELAQSLMMSLNRESRTVIHLPNDLRSPISDFIMSADLVNEIPVGETRSKKKHDKILRKLIVRIENTYNDRVTKLCVTEQVCKSVDCSAHTRLGCVHCHLNDHDGHERLDMKHFCDLFQENLNHYDQLVSQLFRTIPNRKYVKAEIQEHFQTIRNEVARKLEELEDKLLEQVGQAVTVQEPWIPIITDVQNIKNKSIYEMSQHELKQVIQFIDGSLCAELSAQNKNLQIEVQKMTLAIETSVDRYLKDLSNDTMLALEDYSTFRVAEEHKLQDAHDRIQCLERRKLAIDLEIKQLSKIYSPPILDKNTNKISRVVGDARKSELIRQNQDHKFTYEMHHCNPKISDAISENQDQRFTYELHHCNHLKDCNTLTIFECCNKAFNCIACHGLSTHRPSLNNPSERYCKVCKELFVVEFCTADPINCANCL